MKTPSIIAVPGGVGTHGGREPTSLAVGQPSGSLWNRPATLAEAASQKLLHSGGGDDGNQSHLESKPVQAATALAHGVFLRRAFFFPFFFFLKTGVGSCELVLKYQ